MRCADVKREVLAPAPERAGSVRAHVDRCGPCAAYTRAMAELDCMVRRAVVLEPPAALQGRLLALATAAARRPEMVAEARLPAWQTAPTAARAHRAGGLRLVELLVAILVGVACLQLVGWLRAAAAMVADVLVATQLVLASPGARYLAEVGFDYQGLLTWSGLGVACIVLARASLTGSPSHSSQLS